jgi:uncharacterized protein
MREIKKEWAWPLYWGSAFLASGGGEGGQYMVEELEKQLVKGKVIPLINLDELEFDATYLSYGVLGSMLDAHISTGKEGVDTVKEFQRRFTSSIRGLYTIEAASINILFPIIIAGLLDLPFIDGDCMGRAFPELQMTTAEFNDYIFAPSVVCSRSGNIYEFPDEDNTLFELKIRKIVSEEGGNAFLAGLANKGRELKEYLIPGTIGFVHDIGTAFVKATSYQSLMEELIFTSKNSIYGAVIELFIGTVKSIEPTDEVSWLSIEIEGIGNYGNSTASLLIQNETLIAYRDREITAMVPDLINMIDFNTLKPVQNRLVKVGMKIAVIGMPAPVALKTDRALKVIGPKCFGYKKKFEPLEKLFYSYYF